MLKFITTLFGVLFFVHTAARALGEEHPHHFYKISGYGQTSYILGTIHLGVSLDDISPDIKKIVSSSKVVIAEADESDEHIRLFRTDPATYLSRSYVSKPPIVNVATTEKLVAAGVPKAIALKASDSDCSILAVVAYINFKSGPDWDVLEIAHRTKVPVVSLDTAKLRAKALKPTQLMNSCNLDAEFEKYSPEVLRASVMESVKKTIIDYLQNAPLSDDSSQGPIVEVRNNTWLPKILAKLKDGGAFISVGQGHLYGPRGLLKLVQADGYTITPLL